MKHNADYRRCLLTGDVAGLMRLWGHTDGHLPQLSPGEAVIALHMARCEMKYIPRNLKDYSKDFLAERGYRKIDGKWIEGQPKETEVAGSAGIASRSRDPGLSKKIVTAMSDAYQDALAGGVTEPQIQRERMLKARRKIRDKAGLIT